MKPILASAFVTIFALAVPLYHALACPGTWTMGPAGAPATIASAMAFDSARGVAVLHGGVAADGATTLNETWEWDGTTWAQRASSGPRTYLHSMAYDSARQRTVLFGGGFDHLGNTTVNSDTWEWDGTVWTEQPVPGARPPARWAHSMVYDSARAVTVLFGGNNLGGSFSDTWEWDGSAWTQRFGPQPPARSGQAMAYDSTRGVTVLFGGTPAGGGAFLGDTWELDSAGWILRSTGGPPARSGGTMAFDAARAVCVLFGGCSAPGSSTCFMGDTWEWNGTTWMSAATVGPPARNAHVMAYDTWRSVILVTRGTAGGAYMNDLWELRSVPCIADYNCDGFVDGIDSDNFNNDFESTDPEQQIHADINGDGFVDGIDYDTFNNVFESGC